MQSTSPLYFMKVAHELLRSVRNLATFRDLARTDGGLGLNAIGDLVDNFIDSEAMAICVERFRALPGGAAMMDQRYPAFQPDLDKLKNCPEGSLGKAYVEMFLRLNYDPDFFRPRPVNNDALWLTQRIATTHDLHHVISGFSTKPTGELGVLAITATQIGFPAFVLLNLLASFKSFRLQPETFAETSQAIAHGNMIGLTAKPLVLQHWEEGWQKPLDQWRFELGIHRPATGEHYGTDYSYR